MKKSLGMRVPHGEFCEKTDRRGGGACRTTSGLLWLVAQFPAPLRGALPSTAVYLPGLVSDDVSHPTAVHPSRGRAATTRAAAAREAGVPVLGGRRECHRGKPIERSTAAVPQCGVLARRHQVGDRRLR